MKKTHHYFLICLLFCFSLVHAQVPPQGISYQAVAYDSNNNPILTPISLKISIREGSGNGTAVYTETFNYSNPEQNGVPTINGLYSITIGGGTPAQGNSFSSINWGSGNKFLRVEMDSTPSANGSGTNYQFVGSSQLMSVPYALYALRSDSSNSNRVVNVINDLKSIIGTANDIIYIKGHTTPGDGGGGYFIWKTDPVFKTNNPGGTPGTPGKFSVPNNGTIIQAFSDDSGRWVRQYDGFLNVQYFGAMGNWGESSNQLQAAINFAELTTEENYADFPVRSSTIYIPNGDYNISTNIILKDGVSLMGESFEYTNIHTSNGNSNEYLFTMESGRVRISLSNLNIVGHYTPKGCFKFKAEQGTFGDGGLWNSTFKNIQIRQFLGNGIELIGGGVDDNTRPNQFNIFENVTIYNCNDYSTALKINGECGQHTFVNCQFDFFKTGVPFGKWRNVEITNNGHKHAGVITFLNCTFQNSDYGLYINYGDNITVDNCWFENLGVAITIIGGNGYNPAANSYNDERSKSINIVNNRFANAAGFGSLPATGYIKNGQCISVENSAVNIHNNYVAVSNPSAVDPNSSFVYATEGNDGVNLSGNTFKAANLSKTWGVTQIIDVSNYSIDCKSNKMVFVNDSSEVIKTINSSIGSGEKITIKATGGSINFGLGGNINLSNKSSFTLNDNEIAVFVKIDDPLGEYDDQYLDIYQLESVMRASTP